MPRYRPYRFIAFSTLVIGIFCAETLLAQNRLKKHAWSLGTAYEHLQYVATSQDSDQPLSGGRGVLSFGYGKFEKQLFYGLGVDIFFGPYTDVREEGVRTDFYGTGLSFKTSYAFYGNEFRDPNGSISIDLGMSYSDTVGRSVANSPRQDDNRVISELTMRISQISGLLSLSYHRLTPARPAGNTPELLLTRIEGYTTTLGATYPIKASCKTRYHEEKTDENNKTIKSEEVERASLTGYSLFLGFTVLLGV